MFRTKETLIKKVKEDCLQKVRSILQSYQLTPSQEGATYNSFVSHIDGLKLDEIYEVFIKKHPWLAGNEGTYLSRIIQTKNSIREKFLHSILEVTMGVYHPNHPSFISSITTHLVNATPINWSLLPNSSNDLQITNIINTFPFSDVVKKDYFTRVVEGNNIYEKLVVNGKEDIHGIKEEYIDLNHVPSHLDVFRYIKTTTINATPFSLEELMEQDNATITKLGYLFLNIVSENISPLWIFLKKIDNAMWTAYLPSNELISADIWDRFKQIPILQSMKIFQIDYSNNTWQASNNPISAQTAWHAVLFSRIVPGVLANIPDLSSYRTNAPIAALLHNSWDKFVASCATLPHSKNEFIGDSYEPDINEEDYKPLPMISTASIFNKYGIFNRINFKGIEDLQSKILLQDLDEKHVIISDGVVYVKHDTANLAAAFSYTYMTHRSRFIIKTETQVPSCKTTYELANLDTKLHTAYLSSRNINHGYLWNIAARNRFLKLNNLNQADLADTKDSIWDKTGNLLFTYFQNKINVTPEFLNEFALRKVDWSKKQYHCNISHNDKQYWEFAQFAEMGNDGLIALFNTIEDSLKNWDPVCNEPSPNLSICFDLNGGLSHIKTKTSDEYVKLLAEKIKILNHKKIPCTLFRNLSFMLPNKGNLSFGLIVEISELFKQLNERKLLFQHELEYIFLHNVDINSNDADRVLDILEKVSSNANTLLIFSIPDWDSIDNNHSDKEILKRKLKYLKIQNDVVENRRNYNNNNISKHEHYLNNPPKPQVHIQFNKKISLPFGDDIYYPLQHSLSIQHQQQMQQQYQQQQQQQNEQEENDLFDSDTVEPIKPYSGDLNILYTHDHNPNSNLFSKWVSNKYHIRNLIKFIHPVAWKKMYKHQKLFHFGLIRENLPPGFYLAYTNDADENLVLCYDRIRKYNSLSEREAKKPERRNPFTIILHKPLQQKEIRGDLRQLSPTFGSQENETLQNLWQYTSSSQQVSQQSFDICTNALKKWAKENHIVNANEIINSLFPLNQQGMKNLKSFGQLINNFKSSHIIFAFADKIYHHFGEQALLIWKNRILDHSVNWTECINYNELNAICSIITTLKSHLEYAELWWDFLDAHGNAVGPMLCGDLWRAFHTILLFAERSRLVINITSMRQYLKNCIDHNGFVLFGRLYTVLKNAEKYPDKEMVQQNILDHFHEIDWHGNGFYYASQYNHYAYWHKSLELNSFAHSKNGDYSSCYDSFSDITNLKVVTLRNAALRMKLSFKDFVDLAMEFENYRDVTLNQDWYYRLRIVISTNISSVGIANEFNAKSFFENVKMLEEIHPSLITWLNDQIVLDTQSNYAFSIAFLDIHLLLKCLDKFSTEFEKIKTKIDSLFKASLPAKKTMFFYFINICGRALEYFHYHKPDSIEHEFGYYIKLLNNARSFKNPILEIYPWLINTSIDISTWGNLSQWIDPLKVTDDDAQQQIFINQIKSISMKNSSYFPSYQELQTYSNIIKEESRIEDKIGKRREIVKVLQEKGCIINIHEKLFQPLTDLKGNYLNESVVYLENQLNTFQSRQNLVLFKKLFKHLAVPSQQDPLTTKTQLDDLLKIFVMIDNKKYYDELGKVLLTLVDNSYSDKICYFSLTQLHFWLKLFFKQDDYSSEHYPISILSVIISQSKTNSILESLINPDLDKLNNNVNQNISIQKFTEILSAPYPQHYKTGLFDNLLQISPHSVNTANVYRAAQIIREMWENQMDKKWIRASYNFICKTKIIYSNYLNILEFYSSAYHKAFQNYPILAKTWKDTCIFALNFISNDKITIFELKKDYSFFIPSGNYDLKKISIAMIFKILLNRNPNLSKEILSRLKVRFDKMSEHTLKDFCQYFAMNLVIPDQLLEYLELNDINVFSTATSNNLEMYFSKNKHNYNDTRESIDLLKRTISGIKYKGSGKLSVTEQNGLLALYLYCNGFAKIFDLHNHNIEGIKKHLSHFVSLTKDKNSDDKAYLITSILACLREILLRKNGLWINHTQMLMLIHAGLHDDQSFIHEVSTGQGKSILTTLRTAYMALMGYNVHVLSVKNSLSKRDHDTFSAFFDACGIPHAYIKADSNRSAYKTDSGSIHYATAANMNLYLDRHCWNNTSIQVGSHDKLVAYLDEADDLLNDTTEFNTSSNDSSSIYNMDAWVITVTYSFYKEYEAEINRDKKVSLNTHLQALAKRLLDERRYSPEQSTFIDKYLLSSIDGNAESIDIRNSQLLKLIMAAHTANHLIEGRDFSVCPGIKVLINGVTIPIHRALVVINSQSHPNASYSNLVHPFLHHRLNLEASQNGRTPNFFIDPVSQVVLTSTGSNSLRLNYSRLEGCTATASDQPLFNNFGFDFIIKFPLHEENRSEYRPTIYCETEADYIAALNRARLEDEQTLQPVLITAEDDLHVKYLSKFIQVQNIDTNDRNLSELESVNLAGMDGTTTISARMERGTNIFSKRGLKVIRSYPSLPAKEKQERGRQGRNGAKGICQDIIHYGKVKEEYSYFESINSELLNSIVTKQRQCLDKKLQKNNKKWMWLNDDDTQEKWIKSRSTAIFKHKLKQQEQAFLRKKESLVSLLCHKVKQVLSSKKLSYSETQILQNKWMTTINFINLLWSNRLAGKSKDDETVYKAFEDKVMSLWINLCSQFKLLNIDIQSTKNVFTSNNVDAASTAAMPVVEVINLHDDYAQEIIMKCYIAVMNNIDHKMLGQYSNLILLFISLQSAGLNTSLHLQEKLSRRSLILESFIIIFNEKNITYLNTNALLYAINISATCKTPESLKLYAELIRKFLQNLNHPMRETTHDTSSDIFKYSWLFSSLLPIFSGGYFADVETANIFLKKLINVLREIGFWQTFNKEFADNLACLLSQRNSLFDYITKKCSEDDLKYLVGKACLPNSKNILETALKLDKYLDQHDGNISEFMTVVDLVTSSKSVNDIPINPDNSLDISLFKKLGSFLNQNRIVCQNNYTAILKFINSIPTEEKEKTLSLLFNIPPNIPLNYILKHISSTYDNSSPNQLKKLKETGDAFNDYFVSLPKDDPLFFVKSSYNNSFTSIDPNFYNSPKNSCINLLGRFKLTFAKQFFQLAKEYSTPFRLLFMLANTCETILLSKKYQYHFFNPQKRSHNLKVAFMITSLVNPSNQFVWLSFTKMFSQIYSKLTGQQIENIINVRNKLLSFAMKYKMHIRMQDDEVFLLQSNLKRFEDFLTTHEKRNLKDDDAQERWSIFYLDIARNYRSHSAR